MIHATFIRGSRGFEEFHLDGHADYNPGNDIVCAGVSALAYTLLGALDNIEGLDKRFIRIESGKLDIEINPFIDHMKQVQVNTIFQTILIGILQIEKKYPDYVQVIN